MLWVVRAGEPVEPEQHALDEGRMYASWCRLGHDLSALRSQDELHDVLSEGHPDRDRTVNDASQLWLFAHEIEEGDWIVVPSDRGRAFHIGEVVEPYEYHETAEDPYRHSIELRWVAKAVPRSKFDVDLRHAFGGFMKVFRAHRNDAEARLRAMAIAEGWRSPPAEAGSDVESAPARDDPLERDQFENEQTAELIFRRLRRAWSVAKSREPE